MHPIQFSVTPYQIIECSKYAVVSAAEVTPASIEAADQLCWRPWALIIQDNWTSALYSAATTTYLVVRFPSPLHLYSDSLLIGYHNKTA